jgi:hypothetical protein
LSILVRVCLLPTTNSEKNGRFFKVAKNAIVLYSTPSTLQYLIESTEKDDRVNFMNKYKLYRFMKSVFISYVCIFHLLFLWRFSPSFRKSYVSQTQQMTNAYHANDNLGY